MACSAQTNNAPATIAVHALPMATTMEHSITLRETCFAHKKVHLPVPLSGIETDAECALVFYTTVAKIDNEGHNIPYHTCQSVLVRIIALQGITESTTHEVMRTYKDQLWDPSNWTVHSWHDNAGAVITNAGLPANSTILRTIGGVTVNRNRGKSIRAIKSIFYQNSTWESVQFSISPI